MTNDNGWMDRQIDAMTTSRVPPPPVATSDPHHVRSAHRVIRRLWLAGRWLIDVQRWSPLYCRFCKWTTSCSVI